MYADNLQAVRFAVSLSLHFTAKRPAYKLRVTEALSEIGQMNISFGDCEIELFNEPTYSTGSTDNVRQYLNEYIRDSADGYHSAAHGINTKSQTGVSSSAVLIGFGGATGIHERSVAYHSGNLYVAVGDGVCSLSLPALRLNWFKKVDFATCFGVYWLPKYEAILTWGELEIGCYTVGGEERWSTSGPDIFTGDMELHDHHAIVTDFNSDKFRVALVDGAIERKIT